jgi:NHLM bacteriocin system ABC transporter peptidase/ATP-binding protein
VTITPQSVASGPGQPANADPTFPRKRVKVPTILQMEEAECGAAALGMILAGFGRFVSLEELRTACGVSRDGSKASNMLAAARSFGLTAKGLRRPLAKLGEAKLPAILFWRYSHWVVLEGFDGGTSVYLNDPAEGRRRVALSEVQLAYSGVSLEFERGESFQPGGSRHGWIRELLARARPARMGFVMAAIAGLFLVVPGVLLPLFTTVFVNTVIAAATPSQVGSLVFAVGVAATLIGLLTLVQSWVLARMQTRLTVSGSFRLVEHLLHLPSQFFTQRFPGVLVGRLDQIDTINQLLAGPLVTATVSLFGLIIYVIAMAMYSPVLTVIGVVASWVNVAALALVSRQRDAANQQQLREASRLSGIGMSTVSNIEAIKTAGGEDAAFERWAGFQARSLNASQEMGRLTNGLSVVPTTMSSLTTVLVLTIGGIQVMNGSLSLGMLVGFQALMSSFLTPISSMVNMANQAQTAQGQLVQINDVMRNEVDPIFQAEQPVAAPQARLAGGLECRNVEFGYARIGEPLIKDFNLTVAPGQRVALVGGTGSGKSTIVKLIMGLYQPWSGEIRFDGRTRDQWDRALITTSVAFVDQRIMLFEGTVADNLTLWDTAISYPELISAAEDACIHDDIAARSGGYQSLVEEGGRNFNGGQRQRLEIARALAMDPAILVLDEATSALDSDTEGQIDRNLRRRGATCIIVAHRLSTIRDCDEIIVMDAGRIVQRGTHNELIAAGGRYASLVEAE